jgi:hypothetical protein
MTFIPFISFLLYLWKEIKREECMVQPRVVHDAIGRGAVGDDDDDDDVDGGFSNVWMQTIRH